jgi:predicted acylesterase/phospholipase RssA
MTTEEPTEKTTKQYNTIVLSGGITKGFGLVGSLQYLQDNGVLPHIHKFIGTSIGAIIAYLVCIGYSPIEIMIISCQRKIFEKMANIDILNVMHGNGAVSFHIFQEILEKLTIEKIKKFITLTDLYTKFGKELVCCTYNLTLQKPEYISYKTHPDLSCLTALRMSANLPFFFETFVYDDYKYVDGGIADNFPISQVEETDVALGIRTKKVLTADKKREDENVLSQFVAILTVPIGRVEEIQISYETRTDIVSVPIPSYISTSLNLTNTEKFDLFSNGYETIKNFFNSKE